MMTSLISTVVNIIQSLIIFSKLNVVNGIVMICREQQFSTEHRNTFCLVTNKFVPVAGLLDITTAKSV